MKDEAARLSSPRSGPTGRQRRVSDGSSHGRSLSVARPSASVNAKEEEPRRPMGTKPMTVAPRRPEEQRDDTFLTALIHSTPSDTPKTSRARAQELRPPSPLGALDPVFEVEYVGVAVGSADPPATTNYVGAEAVHKFWRIFHRQDAVNKNKAIAAVPTRPSGSDHEHQHHHRPLYSRAEGNASVVSGVDRPRSARTTYLSAVRSMKLCAEPMGIVRRRIVEKGGTASSSASSSVGGSTSQEVNLSSYRMGDNYATAFSAGFPLIPGIEALNVAHNRISDRVAANLISSAVGSASMSNLQQLNLSNNCLSMSSALALCDLLRDSKTLVALNLSHNQLKDREIQLLCDALQKNQTLLRLHLSENKFGLLGMASIAKFLEENAKIEEVYLSWNQIRGAGALKIVEALKFHASLRVCDLSWNSLASNDLLKPRAIISALADALANNKVLAHLDLSNNRLDMEDCSILGKQLENNQTLIGLHMSGNSGVIDSRGFLLPKLNETTLRDQHKSYSMAVFEETYSEAGSGVFPVHLTPLVDKNCWYCAHWTEYRFAWTPLSSQGPFGGSSVAFEITSDMSVLLHLSIDDWRGVPMDKRDDGSFTAYRILPPGRTEYFFSVIDKSAADTTGAISYHFLHEKRHTQLIHAAGQSIEQRKMFGSIEFVNVLRLGRRDGRDPCNTLVPRSSGKQTENRSSWDINKSVFARRKRESMCRNFVDTDTFVAKACTADWRQCKVDRFIKDPVRRKEVETCVTKYFREICNLYRRYCGFNVLTSVVGLSSCNSALATQLQNDVTCIPWGGYMEFLNEGKILDENSDYCKAADLENVFVAANLELTQEAKEKDNPDRSLTRFEFLETIIRIAINKYHRTGMCDTPAKAVEKLMQENLLPISAEDTNEFRNRFLYTEEVNDIFSEHIALLQDIYISNMGKYCKPGEKKGMQLIEFLVLLEKYQVYTDFFRVKDVKDPFLACKLVVLDEMANTSYKKLYMTDFMELAVRVSILRYPPRPLTLPEVVKSLQKLFVNHFYKHETLLDQFCETVDQAVVQDRVEAFATAIASHRRRDEEISSGSGNGGGSSGSSTPRGGSASNRRTSRRQRPSAIQESPAESQEPISSSIGPKETVESAQDSVDSVDESAPALADPAAVPEVAAGSLLPLSSAEAPQEAGVEAAVAEAAVAEAAVVEVAGIDAGGTG